MVFSCSKRVLVGLVMLVIGLAMAPGAEALNFSRRHGSQHGLQLGVQARSRASGKPHVAVKPNNCVDWRTLPAAGLTVITLFVAFFFGHFIVANCAALMTLLAIFDAIALVAWTAWAICVDRLDVRTVRAILFVVAIVPFRFGNALIPIGALFFGGNALIYLIYMFWLGCE